MTIATDVTAHLVHHVGMNMDAGITDMVVTTAEMADVTGMTAETTDTTEMTAGAGKF